VNAKALRFSVNCTQTQLAMFFVVVKTGLIKKSKVTKIVLYLKLILNSKR